jgi:hypothetical protein
VNIGATNNSAVGIQFKPTVGATAAAGTFGFQFTNTASNYGRFFINTRGSDGALERMTITENGNIGIGTSTPGYPLEIKINETNTSAGTSVNYPLSLVNTGATNNSTVGIQFKPTVGATAAAGTFGFQFTNTASNYGRFFINTRGSDGALERMTITENGNVGIGTSTPGYPLEIKINETNTSPGTSANFPLSLVNTGATNNSTVGIQFKPTVGATSAAGTFGFQFTNPTSNYGRFFINTRGSDGALERMTITENGNVGIGTSTPGYPLEIKINETNTSAGSSANYPLSLVNTGATNNSTVGIQFKPTVGATAAAGTFGFQFTNTASNYGRFFINTRGSDGALERMTITENGNIGIGTSLPDTKLTVKGVVHTNEVRVDVNSPIEVGDYVFDKNYNLLTLPEVESYINENKHLPEVPSANQMVDEGLNLKEMNLLLLKKVEELTLHLIEQNKINEAQEKEIAELKIAIKK